MVIINIVHTFTYRFLFELHDLDNFFFFAPPLIYANVYKMNGMKGYEEREKDRKKRESEREGEKDRERVVLSVLEKTFKIIIFVVECIFFF